MLLSLGLRMAEFLDSTEPTMEGASAAVPSTTTQASEKLSTAQLADKLGILVTSLYDKLVSRGYLELSDEGKRRLTAKGLSVGGECNTVKGSGFLWPANLEL
jgi:hypothetical protein